MRDFEAYYAAGATWISGADPYSAAIWQNERTIPGVNSKKPEILPFVGPPLGLPLWAGFARLSYSHAVALWATLLALLLALSLGLIWRFAGGRFDLLSIFSLALFGIGFGPVTSDLALGQVALAAFAFALIAIALFSRQRLGAVAATVLSALQPNIALVMVSQVGRRKALAIFGTALVVFAALCSGVGGPNALPAYLGLLASHGAAERFSLIQITPGAVAYGFGITPQLALWIEIGLALTAIWVWFFALRTQRPGAVAMLAISCTLLPIVVPFFHEHDLLVLLLPALYCCTHARGRIWQLAAFATLLIAIDWLGLAQRPGGVLQSALLAGATLCAYGILAQAQARALILPSFVILLAIIAGWVAQTHVAPIWPQSMHLAATPAIAVGLPEIWQSEQRNAGLLAPNSFWAVLRLLSLLGCALLAYCTIRSGPEQRSPIRYLGGVPKD